MPKLKLHFQRFEFKYYLPKSKADKLIPALLNYLDWDPYIKELNTDFYQVNSLYFDNQTFGCYWDKESGLSDRKKLRLRYYNQLSNLNSPVFLEIKRKKDALVIKDRISIDAASSSNDNFDKKLSELLNADQDNDFLHELVWFKKRNTLRPKLFVSYKIQTILTVECG